MNHFHVRSPSAHLRAIVFIIACGWVASAHAQPVTWQDLPWPSNQDWTGPQGAPAVTNGNQIVLTGQDVLSVQSFAAGPLSISYDVILPAKTTTDGIFEFFFVPVGEATTTYPNPDVLLQMSENQTGNDFLGAYKDHGATALWGNNPFSVATQTVYHVSISLAANGQVGWSINGNDVGLSNAVVMPYSNFQIRLSSWQPTQVWQVSNFEVVPEPATATLLGVGLVSLFTIVRRRKL